jgi:hypothetical protein
MVIILAAPHFNLSAMAFFQSISAIVSVLQRNRHSQLAAKWGNMCHFLHPLAANRIPFVGSTRFGVLPPLC